MPGADPSGQHDHGTMALERQSQVTPPSGQGSGSTGDVDQWGLRLRRPMSGRTRALLLYTPFVFAVALTFAYSPDDAFITLRYAYNLLHGHGPVYNPGDHVNGSTSPAGLALAIVALAIPGGYTLLKLKLLSLLFAFLTVRAGGRLLDTFNWPGGFLYVGLPLMGFSPAIAFAAATGLETTVASFAITSLVLTLRSPRVKYERRAVAYGALAVFARPEAILAVSFIAVAALCIERSVPWFRRVRWWLLGPLLVEVVLLGWNRLYYGAWVPNTYLAKESSIGAALHSGLKYLFFGDLPNSYTEGIHLWIAGALAVGLDALLIVGAVAAAIRYRTYGYIVAAALAQVLFVLKSGDDWMKVARFLEPVEPCLIVLQLLGAAVLFGWIVERVHRSRVESKSTGEKTTGNLDLVVGAVLLGGLVMGTCFAFIQNDPVWTLQGVSDQALVSHSGDQPYSSVWAEEPRLFACARAGQLVATTEAGYGPFVDERLPVLDLRGLTNREIAETAPSSLKSNVGVIDTDWYSPTSPVGEVVLQERPVLIVTVNGPPVRRALDGEYRLIETQDALGLRVYARVGTACSVGNP